MINYTVEVDTLKIQIDFISNTEQREVMDRLARALHTTYPFLNVNYNTNPIPKGAYTHSVVTAGTKILELVSGAYKDMHKRTIYFITVEVAGLKQYNNNDKIAMDCLRRVVAFLNSNMIQFSYTGIDIAVDMVCPFIYTYAFCNKKAAGVKYYKVFEYQPYSTTHYLEKYDNTHNRVMKRSYLYDKSIKENNITYPITRFELKLQSSFFNRYSYQYGMLQSELNRYHILYFPTLQEKDAALSLYAQHEDTIRRRDLHTLGLERYRIYPDTSGIEDFLMGLYNVYEHDLDLPVVEVDSEFDFLFVEE